MAIVWLNDEGRIEAQKSFGGFVGTELKSYVTPREGPRGSRGWLVIRAHGLHKRRLRTVFGGVPEEACFVLDYGRSGGAKGPRMVPFAEEVRVPITRGICDGEILIKVLMYGLKGSRK
jgi:hypothetical protein